MKQILSVLIMGVMVFGFTVAFTSATVDPRFEAYVPEPQLQLGLQQELSVQLMNDAREVDEWVKSASNVKVTAQQGSTPFRVLSGTRLLGVMEDGVPQTVSFQIEVPGNTSSGVYNIPIIVTYDFGVDERATSTIYAQVVIPEHPLFVVRSIDSDLYLDETGVITVTMANTGSQIGDETSLEITSVNPELTLYGTQSMTNYVGSWMPGEDKQIMFPVTVSQSTIGKKYVLNVQPTYYDPNHILKQASGTSFEVVPRGIHRFLVTQSTAMVSVGESGPLRISLLNQGNTTLSDVSVQMESTSPFLTFDGKSLLTQFVGQWEPGETKTVIGELTTNPNLETLQHSIQATVVYDHPAGVKSQSGPYDADINIHREQTFSYSNVSVTLLGNSGLLQTKVTNNGDRGITNAVLSLQSMGSTIRVIEPTDSIGDLGPGESAPASFELRVAEDAIPGVRQFQARVQYGRDGVETFQSNLVSIQAAFETDKKLFIIESLNASFPVDTSNRLEVKITNNGVIGLTDIYTRLEVTPPYESKSSTSYIASLESGESEIIAYELTTPEDAVETTDAVSINISAKSHNDQTIVAGPYLVSFQIREPSSATSNTMILVYGAITVMIILGAGWWWVNR